MNALLNYPGDKWGMAEEIVALMPSHRSYMDPFLVSVRCCLTNRIQRHKKVYQRGMEKAFRSQYEQQREKVDDHGN